jgi:hypothetical protein
MAATRLAAALFDLPAIALVHGCLPDHIFIEEITVAYPTITNYRND